MIRYLRLNNFRRHADTEISFDQEGQIILIAGQNGVGKSTVIEALLYGLYGEGRHGNRQLDRMIRRGAELEGMEVELEFDLAAVTYRVKRRRDNGISSAILWGNDVALFEGTREVTSEIARLFGMDARGFRLAVVAQQKELDGLASMRPAERAATLARLLRLDVVTQARDRARAMFRSERDALRGLGSVESTDTLVAEVAAQEQYTASLAEALLAADAEIARLQAAVVAGAAIESAYEAALRQLERCKIQAISARDEHARLETELSGILVTDAPAVLPDLDALADQIAVLERTIAVAEANARLASQVQMVTNELSRVDVRADEVATELAALVETDARALRAGLDDVHRCVVDLRGQRDALVSDQARAQGTKTSSEERLRELQGLDASCDLCGQSISDEHRAAQQQSATSSLDGAVAALASIGVLRGNVEIELAEADGRAQALERALTASDASDTRRTTLRRERDDLARRRTTYDEQLQRITVDTYDLPALQQQRGALAIAAAEAQGAHEAAQLRELVLERRSSLAEATEAARVRLDQATAAVTSAAIDEQLRQAATALAAQHDALDGETSIRTDLGRQAAVHDERLAAARRELVRLEATHARRTELERKGQVASEAAAVLDAVSTRLNQQIRPALEGAVGELLSRLSDGRFDAVALDEEYNLSVRDDGAFRPLGEFSGGEVDLIALARRLALAGVVSERHGAGGAGFLILDECFGSQDHGRRESIMTALRSLRGTYRQILLISHVGGLEDSADRVIDISTDEETGVACLTTA